jgi:hypothetical protein
MTFKLQLEFKIVSTLYKQHVILHIKIWYFSNFICFIQLINGFSSNPSDSNNITKRVKMIFMSFTQICDISHKFQRNLEHIVQTRSKSAS